MVAELVILQGKSS